MQLYGVQSTALRYFLEVARCGSISEASIRLNVASSAVSRQISKLERELDALLFERQDDAQRSGHSSGGLCAQIPAGG